MTTTTVNSSACAAYRSQFELAAVEALSDIEKRRLEAHVASCAECATAYRQVCCTVAAVRAAGSGEGLSENRIEGIRAAVRDAVVREQGTVRTGAFQPSRLWAVAACAVAALGGLWMVRQFVERAEGGPGMVRAWSHAGLHALATSTVSAPAASGTMVFALQRTADGDLVTALDLTEGRPVWSSTARSQGYLSTDRSRVYTVSAERGHEGTLLALDATSGVERWRFDPPNGRGTRGKVVPAGARVLWTAGSELWALDTLSGAAVWHVGVQSGSVSEPVHVMDRVLVVCGNELLCLDLVSGARVWTALIADEAPVLARAQMSFSDNRLFVSHTGNGLSGHVTCVDAGDGAVVWDRSGVSAAHITACGSMVYVRGGDVSALDASTGQTVWSVAAEGCSPLYCLYGSVVFADASREDALAVLDGLTGAPRRHLALPNACAGFVPTPTSLGLVADNNGVLHAIDTRRAFGAI